MGNRHFRLNFTECTPPQAASVVEVPQTIQFSFMTYNEKTFRWTSSYTLSPPSEVTHSESSTTAVQQYDLVKNTCAPSQKNMLVDCCLAIEVNDKIQPFSVTIRDGKSYFTDVVGHWVVCSHSGIMYAKSLDAVSNPFDVQWWQCFEDSRLQYSGMDICVSVPGPAWTHDINFIGSDNVYLNCLFSFKGLSTAEGEGMTSNIYEFVDAKRAVVMQINFSSKLQKWLITSLDQAALPLQWNLIASSNCSGTYTNPTLCKEWYVLDYSGTYRYSSNMTCEIKPRRLVCSAVDVSHSSA
jgi:hypothetical protein